MASETVKFARNFDYTHADRSQTAYKAGFSGRVLADVAGAARDAGALDDTMPTSRADLDALAIAEGVDLAAIVGTGANGRVVSDDVTAAILANRATKTDEFEPGVFTGGEAPTE